MQKNHISAKSCAKVLIRSQYYSYFWSVWIDLAKSCHKIGLRESLNDCNKLIIWNTLTTRNQIELKHKTLLCFNASNAFSFLCRYLHSYLQFCSITILKYKSNVISTKTVVMMLGTTWYLVRVFVLRFIHLPYKPLSWLITNFRYCETGFLNQLAGSIFQVYRNLIGIFLLIKYIWWFK